MDQADGLREFVAVTVGNAGPGTPCVMWSPTPDKSALWDSLKSDLEHEASDTWEDPDRKHRHGDYIKASIARAMLDRMMRMEEIAKPADAETFARVRSDMGASRG